MQILLPSLLQQGQPDLCRRPKEEEDRLQGQVSSIYLDRSWERGNWGVLGCGSALYLCLFEAGSAILVVLSHTSLWILWSVHLLLDPVSHEQKLSQSLEIALTSTLGSMPSFTARLTRGQLQHLGTRGSSTSWRPGTSSGNMGPVHLLGALEWGTGPCLWGSVDLHAQLLSPNTQTCRTWFLSFSRES